MHKGMCLHLCVIWQPAFMYLLHGGLRLGDDYIMLYLRVAYMTVMLR